MARALASMPVGPRRLRVTVAGGGPVGLAFALCLRERMGDAVHVSVHDHRWTRAGGGLRWKDEAEGNRRRTQVVTLQGNVVGWLPPAVRAVLLGDGGWSTSWPLGRDSPHAGAPPRNIRIADMEDRFLALARSRRIALLPGRYEPPADGRPRCDVLVACDGARSRVRDAFPDAFPGADPRPYSLGGRPVEDAILGLEVSTALDPTASVVLTVAQNRFLLNAHGGRGVLNMRLTAAECAEVRMVGLDGEHHPDCFLGCACPVVRLPHRDGVAYACRTHGTVLAAVPGAAVWHRMAEGLRLFGVRSADLSGMKLFRASMAHRSRFTAELVPRHGDRDATFGALLGDAANALHFWPGRGLNSGLSSAVSLAACLSATWAGRSLRHADFARHEANMHMLQHRHKGRAWAAMTVPSPDGSRRPVAEAIAEGIAAADLSSAGAMRDEFMARLGAVSRRMAGRLTGADEAPGILAGAVARLDAASLASLVAGGAWDTVGAGGEEVDVTRLFADPVPPAPPALARATGFRWPRPSRAGTPGGGMRIALA